MIFCVGVASLSFSFGVLGVWNGGGGATLFHCFVRLECRRSRRGAFRFPPSFNGERGKESGIDQTFFGAATQMNLEKSAGVPGRVLFSF